jgi:hypothetical protein
MCSVLAREIPVQLDGLGPQARPLVYPGFGVLGERDPAVIRVDPVAVADLGFLEGSARLRRPF